jgi:hypothetical protein
MGTQGKSIIVLLPLVQQLKLLEESLVWVQ